MIDYLGHPPSLPPSLPNPGGQTVSLLSLGRERREGKRKGAERGKESEREDGKKAHHSFDLLVFLLRRISLLQLVSHPIFYERRQTRPMWTCGAQ